MKEKDIIGNLIRISNISKGLVLNILFVIYIILPIFTDISLPHRTPLSILFGTFTVWYWFCRRYENYEKRKGTIRPKILIIENIIETFAIGIMLWFLGRNNGLLFFMYAFVMMESCLLLTTKLPWVIGGIIGGIITVEFVILVNQGEIIPNLQNILYYFLRLSFSALLTWHFKTLAEVNILEMKRTSELRKACKDLKKLDVAKSEFISIASHQLRTPLSIIKGNLEMLLAGDIGDITEKQKDVLKEASSGNERMIKLVNDLTNATRITEGELELKIMPQSLEDLVAESVVELMPFAKEHHVSLSFNPPSSPLPQVNADPEKTKQTLQNLIDNAVKYSCVDSKGAVVVEVKKDSAGKFLEINIKDNGIGIPKAEQEKIFERFFRASNSSNLDPGGGTGLGLYIAKGIIEQMGGKIWFESEKGKGTTFYFTLPIAK